ncbi:hypothetical protein PA598K_04982 [Paenibacillus sp. 598K]|uniref:hypothetical protein n=1 Tax=Paenibacillus sp. 598K TaxID=1117987 RepID=UPI000FF96312|nr:hypothetical protein [Paenibacillus sp. 598K]GBF76507.1 hypothetical protein PA598K_04982 [Paenibacillus sp. 598K]
MYTVSVPVEIKTINEKSKFDLLKRLQQLNANEVFLIPIDVNQWDDTCESIRTFIPFFTSHNIDVCLWIGGSLAHYIYPEAYDTMIDVEGGISQRICPLDQRFEAYFCELFKKIAATGVQKIALDDDYRMNWTTTPPSCFCPKHLELYSNILKESVTLESMREGIYSSDPDKYRNAWLEGSRESLCQLARAIRRSVDEIDESINIVLCSGPAHWGADGAGALELATIFAGNNHKELRLSGAPFWGQRVGTAMDFARKQAVYCKKHGIRTLAEGDAYPRPRYAGPASGIENLDLIARADGNFDGILKYGLDYNSSPNYEPGYAEFAERNRTLHQQTETMFAGKQAQGIHLFEPLDIHWHTRRVSHQPEFDAMWSPGVAFLNDNSIPAVFEPGGVNLVFGQNAWMLDPELLTGGTILDYTAAKILAERGIDVGIIEELQGTDGNFTYVGAGSFEYYKAEQETVALYGNVSIHNLVVNEQATILTEISVRKQSMTGAYLYENENNQRFLVFPFDAQEGKAVTGLFRSYCRQRQLMTAHEWLCGRKLDAICPGNPDLYLIVKKDEESMAVGLWNFFPDRIQQPVIELADDYTEIEFLHCTGTLSGRIVQLDSPLHAFEYCAFSVKK